MTILGEYLHLEVEGRTLARMLDNVMLFNDDCPADWPKAGKILVAMDTEDIALWASDKYSVVREGPREHPGCLTFELTNEQGKQIAAVARGEALKPVSLDYEPNVLFVEGAKGEWAGGVTPVVGDELWTAIAGMLPAKITRDQTADQWAYGWSLDRLQRFGRVKVPTGQPKTADIWYAEQDHGAVAHVLVGNTFQGALKSLSRKTLLLNNPDALLWDLPE